MRTSVRRASCWLPALCLAAALAYGPVRAEVPARSADEIVAAADRGRNGWDSFSVDVRITNYKKDRLVGTSNYEVLIKGANRTLVRFSDPNDKGKLMLMVEDAMWLYMPSTSQPIRVTPLQRLSGNASNGDVAQTSLSANYTGVLAGEESVEGEPAYVLELSAKRKSATYQKARYWVSRQTLLPLKAEFQLTSGKASKVSRFETYGQVAGKRVLKRQVIYDLLRSDQKTVMEYERYEPRDLADRLFNRNFLAEL
jgi:outer membrane lipoprotein-sorting protein